jgi:hypothetical protein
MALFDIFSKRQRILRGEVPDVYQYGSLPDPFRAQVVHILHDLFGSPQHYGSQTEEAFSIVHNALCREHGQFRLSERFQPPDFRAAVCDFVMKAETEKALDAIELALRLGEHLQTAIPLRKTRNRRFHQAMPFLN